MATMAPVHKHAQGALISRSGGHTSPNGVFLKITKMLPAASCLSNTTVIRHVQRPEPILLLSFFFSLLSLSVLYYLVVMKFEVVWKSSVS
jgi:hypothetical protein